MAAFLLVLGTGEACAQRARKHRAGQLSADSLRAQFVADSLALLDTVRVADPSLPVSYTHLRAHET